MDRRSFLQHLSTAAAATACTTAIPAIAKPAARQPNFVIVLADDMGFSDAGCFGGEIDTPTIDGLAKGGTRFTQMYSTARCGPSRDCLMTGMYAQQTAADIMTPGNIPDYVHFIPEHLKAAGYRNYHSGKWHFRIAPLDNGVGFDHTYTMMDENRFFTQKWHQLDEKDLPAPGPGYYSTTAIADHAVDFLQDHDKSHKGQPFFLYLAFHAPHFPLQAPQPDIDHYKGKFEDGWDAMRERRFKRLKEMGIVTNCDAPAPLEADVRPPWNLSAEKLAERIGPGEVANSVPWNTLNDEQKKFQAMKFQIHAAMITRMDTETGKVVSQLKKMGVFEDTVIIFLSDNGASAEEIIRGEGHDKTAAPGSGKTHLSIGPAWASAADTPLRLHKSWVHEGGISSPMVVSWPNGISNGGKLRTDPCHFIDVLPTFVDLAGSNVKKVSTSGPELPGKSLAKAIRNATPTPRDYIYFNHNKNHALRTQEWKLVSKGANGPWELYDMRTDRCEQHNLIAKEKARADAMAATWKEMDDRFVSVREAAKPTSKRMMEKRKLPGESA